MANDLEGFAQWQDNIEARVSTLETTVETEATVRAQMDEDMSNLKVEFRVQKELLQALAETQSDHTATLAGHTATLAEHTATLADHTQRLIRLESGMTDVQVGIRTIIGLLDRELDDEEEPDEG